MTQFQTATITKTQLSPNFYELDCHPHQSLNFHPGQYLIIKVNETRVVQYSLASPRSQTNFKLLTQYIPSGEASEWVKNQLSTGDSIEYFGPLGNFLLHPPKDTDQIIFLATGSGIAPFLSMIPELLTHHSFTKPIVLYFGIRDQTDLIYQTELQLLTQKHPNFKHHICLTQPDKSWKGRKGRITKHLLHDYDNLSNTALYLCGSSSMIQEAKQIALEKDALPENLHHEKFW